MLSELKRQRHIISRVNLAHLTGNAWALALAEYRRELREIDLQIEALRG